MYFVGFRRNVWEAGRTTERRREGRFPVYQLSPNIELLFTEAGDADARVRAAAAAGFDAVEMWFSTDKDLDALGKALADTGVQLTALLAGPRMGYTFPGTDLAPFPEGLDIAVEHARQLSCPRVVLASGVGFPGMNRTKNLQVIIDMFGEAVERTSDSGVDFVLEPVNSRVDHPGALTDRRTTRSATCAGAGPSPCRRTPRPCPSPARTCPSPSRRRDPSCLRA